MHASLLELKERRCQTAASGSVFFFPPLPSSSSCSFFSPPQHHHQPRLMFAEQDNNKSIHKERRHNASLFAALLIHSRQSHRRETGSACQPIRLRGFRLSLTTTNRTSSLDSTVPDNTQTPFFSLSGRLKPSGTLFTPKRSLSHVWLSHVDED